MRRYETIFIVRQNIAEDEIESVINRTTSIVEGDGGTIFKVDKWGLKKLAYLIKKETQGYYVYIDYAGVPASVFEMERIFRIDDKVLKYLTVKLADSCDPEVIKEELAKAEEKVKEEAIPAEPVETPAEEEVKEEATPAEPVETPAEEEVKEEATPAEPVETPAEKASPSEEKQAE